MKAVTRVLFWLIFWPSVVFSSEALPASSEKLVYARIAYSPIQNVAERLLSVVYQRADVAMEIVQLPAKRAAFETGNGVKDGEIMRIKSYGDDKPDLYRIPYPLGFVKTQMYVHVKHQSIDINDLYRCQFGVVKGVRHTNEYVSGYLYVYNFNNVNLLMKQLGRGKFDVAVVSEINARYELAQHPNKNVTRLGDPVTVQGAYHYINIKYPETIQKVERVMLEMTESGELLALWEQYVDELTAFH